MKNKQQTANLHKEDDNLKIEDCDVGASPKIIVKNEKVKNKNRTLLQHAESHIDNYN